LNEASSALQLFVGTPDQAVPSRRAEFNHGATETANERARQRWFAELPDELLRSLWLDEGDTDH
jgi:hypothetical protein